MPRKKKVDGHKTHQDNAFALTKEPLPRRTAAKILRTQVVLNFGLEKSGLDVTEFGRRYIETDSSQSGEVDPSKLLFKWLAGDNAATRKKFENAGHDIPGLLELYDWCGFELLEDVPLSQGRIDEILLPYESRGPSIAWSPPGDFNLDPKSATWMPGPGRRNTERLIHWKNLDGFLILLGLVRESEMLARAQEHIRAVMDLYRSLPTVAAMSGFRQCRSLLYFVVERIHLRCPLSRMMIHVMWDQIDVMASDRVQAHMATALKSEQLWRDLKNINYDVVTYRKLTPQELRENPLNPEDVNEFFHRVLFLDGKRTKTIRDIAEMGAVIESYFRQQGR